eukprot:3166981-Amphidinium_carterae.1
MQPSSCEKVKAFVLKNFVILGITFGLIPPGLLLGAVQGQLLRQSGVRSEDEALGQGQPLRQSSVRNEDEATEGLLPKMTVMILTARRKNKTTRDVMRRQWHQ